MPTKKIKNKNKIKEALDLLDTEYLSTFLQQQLGL